MSVDDVMMAMSLGGIGLTGAYFQAELTRWSRLKTVEHRREQGLKALYSKRFSAAVPVAASLESALATVPHCQRGTPANQSHCRIKRAA